MKIPLSKAEKLKVEHGCAEMRESDAGKTIKLEDDMHFEGREIDAALLNQVIHMRIREVFEFMKKKIARGDEMAKIGAGIFLTGGSSKLDGIDKVAEEVFELPVQRSSIRSMSGTASAFENPQYSTPMGLVRYAQILESDKPAKKKGLGGLFKRFKK